MAYAIVDKNPAVREIIVDTDDDIATLSTTRFAPGSTAKSIASDRIFILTPACEWNLADDK